MVEAHRDDARLDHKIAVVTGGTQGIGEAIARLFAARGAAGIAICGRNVARGKAVSADLDRAGCRAEFVQADHGDLDQARAVIAAADRAFGRIDTLVNAAGITDRGTISDTTPDLFERMMAVNLRAPFFLIQDAAEVMRRERIEGTIVNILSMSAHGGQPFLSPYSISKGALATLTKNAAFSLMPWRIRVNGLNLGWMDTPGEDRIMRLYHGPVLTDGPITEAEQYTISAAWLAFGVVLIVVGFVFQSRPARLASAAVIVLTVAKVFLGDMYQLTGMWRALSFLALGFVLLGIGYLYQRLLFPAATRQSLVGRQTA